MMNDDNADDLMLITPTMNDDNDNDDNADYLMLISPTMIMQMMMSMMMDAKCQCSDADHADNDSVDDDG